ncbi:MAG: hypothetical protein CL537_09725 [Alcanivoracaceae bacterium]|nr:hypothetical protein [Alcanivoracaceae bacterium]|tara:strand:- start:1402 stop:1722 length:321 start_codon:yes stop_codon:yes gene_type:complete
MDRIYHPIIDSPHLFDIEYFSYKFVESNNSDSYVDLHLKKDGKTTKLRFWGPQDLEIEKGFPWATGGMFIEDITSHGLEALNIYVGDFESNGGSITFWAKSVEKVD